MSNFRQNVYEWPLEDSLGGYYPGLVILARFEIGYGGVGAFVSFEAEYRGLIFFPKSRSKDIQDLQGAEYRKRLPAGPTFYARYLMDDLDKQWLGQTIDWIARGGLTGAAARDAVWGLFFQLALRDREWIDSLNNDWLSQLGGPHER